MPTIQELLGSDFGLEDTVKTASVEGDDELERIAAELGFGKFAEDDKEEEEEDKEEKKAEDKEEEEEEEEEKEEKKASALTGSLFDQLFPEDSALSKTAEEQEKIAHEQNLGARAYDVFAQRFDRRIEKLAADLAANAPTAADKDGNAHTGDKSPPQQSKTNKAGDAADKIDTTPVIDNELPPKNDASTVGHFEAKHAAVMNAAMRKALLLSQLEE